MNEPLTGSSRTRPPVDGPALDNARGRAPRQVRPVLTIERLKRGAARYRRSTYRGVISAYGMLTFACVVALGFFAFLPIEPFAYYKDLGFDHGVTAWAAHEIRSPLDFFDTLGWSPWNGTRLFYLNSYLPILVSAPLAKLVGNAWFAMKLVAVLQAVVAAAGAYAMFAAVRRSSFWALVFAVLYAALPITALAIRGNMGLGWIAALAPGAYAVGRFLVRRYGTRAIPLVGILCGVVGYVIAIEYLLFVSMPLLALIVLGEWRRDRPLRSLAGTAGAIGCCLAAGAFFLIPTFVHPLFSDSEARTSTLVTGAFLDNFSETLVGLFTLVPRESLSSPMVEFNASAGLPLLYVFGTLCWLGAIYFVATNRARVSSTDPISLTVVGACIVLALGTTVPFGRALWSLLATVPHLDAIRTTDRFLAIPALMLTFWFVLGLERIAMRWRRVSAGVPWIALALTIEVIAFDGAQHCFALDPSVGKRLPQRNAVQDTVAAIGGRTASFAGVNGGSFDDAPGYGNPAPIDAAYWDLGGRFLEDGVGAAGVLGRMATRSVITAPDWTYDTPFLPDTTDIYRHVRVATTAFESPENVRVWHIPSREMISGRHITCVAGGPGIFDLLDVLPSFDDEAFADVSARCTHTGFVDFDPRDDWREHRPTEWWPGSALRPTAATLRDRDYPFVPNRVLLNLPWYRNSLDGERPVFGEAGALDVDGIPYIFRSRRPWIAGSMVDVRIAAHAYGRIELTIGNVLQQQAISPRPGFQWFRFAVPRPVPSGMPIRLAIVEATSIEPPVFADFNGFALDGLVVEPRASPAPDVRNAAFSVFSLDRLDRIPPPETSDGAAPFTAVALDGFRDDAVAGRRRLIIGSSNASADYRWDGPSGRYEISAKALVDPNLAIVSIDDAGRSELRVGGSLDPEQQVLVRRNLVHGAVVRVRIAETAFQPTRPGALTSIDARPVEPMVILPAGAPAVLDFSDGVASLARIDSWSGIALNASGVEGVPGGKMAFRIELEGHPTALALVVDRDGDGTGTLGVRCGRTSRSVPLTASAVSIALARAPIDHCRADLLWKTGTFRVERVHVIAAGARRPPATGRIWVPAGTYNLRVVSADGSSSAADVAIEGCAAVRCRFASSGFRSVRVGERRSDARLIVLSKPSTADSVASVVVHPTDALRWNVEVRRPGDVELAQLYDGEWRIVDDRGRERDGERCDITDTCFADLPTGTYHIFHRWPRALGLGSAITLGTTIAALMLMLIPSRRRPAEVSRRHR